MTDSMTDALTTKGTLVLVNDKIQRNYRSRRTETAGKNFTPDFVPEPTPARCSPQAFLEEKYLSDGRGEIPANQFARAKLSPQGKTPQLNYLGIDCACRPRQRQALPHWANASREI